MVLYAGELGGWGVAQIPCSSGTLEGSADGAHGGVMKKPSCSKSLLERGKVYVNK